MSQIDLSVLKDVHEPKGIFEPSFWPPAVIWWVLLLIIMASPFVFYLIRTVRIKSAKVYALKQLDLSEANADTDVAKFASEVSKLLKRIAILRFGKEKVATLSDKEWVSFIMETGDIHFSPEIENLLAYSPYAKIKKSDKKIVSRIKEAAEIWIKKNT